MKKGSIVMALFFLTSCGSIRVVPKGCKTEATYGANPLSTREVTYQELEEQRRQSVVKKSFTVFKDTDVRIKDLLEEANMKCEDLKKLRVSIKTSWFVFREVEIKAIRR